MPWSKIVKRYLPEAPEIHPYVLEEVEAPQETVPEASPNEAGAEASVPAHISSPALDIGYSPSSYEEGYTVGLIEGEAKGFMEGKAQGLAEGETKGFTEGKAQGLAEGEAKGFAEGKAQGLAEGEVKGFTEGKVQGLAEGEAKGFAEGESLGKTIREEELQEWERTYQMAMRFIEDFQYLSETYVSDAEQDLLQVAVAIAQKIIKKELVQDHEGIVEMVQAALKEIPPAQTIVLRVHPQDVEIVTRKKPALLEAIEGVGFLRIEPDPQLNPGDSLLETEEHIVDARPDVQLDAIKKKLLPPGEA